jgi:hypothetical protein
VSHAELAKQSFTDIEERPRSFETDIEGGEITWMINLVHGFV